MRRRKALRTLLRWVPLLAFVTGSLPATAQEVSPAEAFLDRLDRIRAAASIPLLGREAALGAVALELANGIAQGSLSLRDPTANGDVIGRASSARYQPRALSVLLAAGVEGDEAAMSEWLSSEGNAASLLSTRFQHIGVARLEATVKTPNGDAEPLWVAVLGEPLEQPVPKAAARLLDAVIAHRRGRGLPPLSRHPQLDRVAMAHAADLARRNALDHTDGQGRDLRARLDRAGYPIALAVENLAAGRSDPKDVVAAWAASDGHRRNMGLSDVTQAGIGYVPNAIRRNGVLMPDVWVLILARPSR